MLVGIDPSLTSTGIYVNGNAYLVKSKPNDELHDPVLATIARCNRIMRDINEILLAAAPNVKGYNFFLEGPVFFRASHLFEMGIYYDSFHKYFHGPPSTIVTVNPTTLKKFISGKGNTSGNQVPLILYKKYGVEFANDPGFDMAHAFALYKIGEAITSGDYEHTAQRRRTSTRKAKSAKTGPSGDTAVQV